MISVIVCGRNDSCGYNLEKRAAIGLNCIAEMLSGKHDEILVVDYNTPDQLPTFIEAIYDTLTMPARQLLRVFRVRATVHRRLYGRQTPMAALEAIARNVAIRRSNPANRWILSTNIGMIFVPRDGVSDLTRLAGNLPEGHYILPRLELPPRLWESLPRSEPRKILRACRELGPALNLGDVTAAAHSYMRFDAVDDFMLMPRRTMFDVFGFDERMIHDGNVGLNMCTRLYSLHGLTGNLADRLEGYHCDVARVPTSAPPLEFRLENDFREFIHDVEHPHARHQAASWGLPGESIEEINLTDPPSARVIRTLHETLGTYRDTGVFRAQTGASGKWSAAFTHLRRLFVGREQQQRILNSPGTLLAQSDPGESRNYVQYDPKHLLPFLAGELSVHQATTRFVYIGTNQRTLELLSDCLGRMGFARPVTYLIELIRLPLGTLGNHPATPLSREKAADDVHATAIIKEHDVLVFDFGLDRDRVRGRTISRLGEWPREMRFELGAVARHLRSCVDQCHEVSVAERDPSLPLFVLLNANDNPFEQFASQFLLLTRTPHRTRVRTGWARVGRHRLYLSERWKRTEHVMRSTFGYDVRETAVPRISVGESIDLTRNGRGHLCKDGHWGWSADSLDATGTWTDGRTADILLNLDPSIDADILADVRIPEAFITPSGDPIRVNVLLAGEWLAQWILPTRFCQGTRRLLLPGRLLSGGSISRLTFEVENPRPPGQSTGDSRHFSEDSRELGIKVQSITLNGLEELSYQLAESVEFTAGGNGSRYLLNGWTIPNESGVWTSGPRADLVLRFEELPAASMTARFTIGRVAVNDEFPYLHVTVLFNGHTADQWVLGPSRKGHDREVAVTPNELSDDRQLRITFEISRLNAPGRPGQPLDPGLQGFRVTRFRVRPGQPRPIYRLGETIDFAEGGNAAGYLSSHWSEPDPQGRWMEGPEASIVLLLAKPITKRVTAHLLISDCMPAPAALALPIRVFVNGSVVDDWVLRPDRIPRLRSLDIPLEFVAGRTEMLITFTVKAPRSPAISDWRDGTRRPGIRVTRAVVMRADVPCELLTEASEPQPLRR